MKRILQIVVLSGVALIGAYVGAQAAEKKALLGSGLPPSQQNVEWGKQIAEELNVPAAIARTDSTARYQEFMDFGNQYVLPGVYGRAGLTPREREIVVIATIITQGYPAGLDWHLRDVGPRVGLNERNIREIMYTTCFYAGWPKCSGAVSQFNSVLQKQTRWPADFLEQPGQNPNKAK